MRMTTMCSKIIYALSLCALLLNCTGVSPKAHFYTLNTLKTPQVTVNNHNPNDHVVVDITNPNVRIQILPISINETVDRPQIAITNTQAQVQFLEQQRWAQPLKYEIGRVVGEHLNQLIPNSVVSAYPHQLSNATDQITLQIINVESSFTTPANIKVNYTVQNVITKKSVSHTQEYSQPLAGGLQTTNINDIIEAHSQNILHLSQDVANTFKAM